jgi:hydroxymethylbilane synthase
MKKKIRLGTRKSRLAMTQSGMIAAELERLNPGISVELVEIVTRGDKILDAPLARVGGKGLFVKEIEEAMLDGRSDMAVHSLKDVPAELPDGLEVTVFPEREDFRDAFISGKAATFQELPDRAVVGTSSLRRMSQLKKARPDLDIRSLRGNVDTRLGKLEEGMYDAIILASAGMNRLGFSSRITSLIGPELMLPAVGQGCLGIEFRSEDEEMRKILSSIHHEPTALCVRAERAFLLRLEGGCQVPIGALASLEGDRISLEGMVADEAGERMIRRGMEGGAGDPEGLGVRLAEDILAAGGKEILEEVYCE